MTTPDRLSPFEELGHGQVLVRGAALVQLVRFVEVGVRAARRDGIDLPDRVQDLVDGLRRQAAEAEALMSVPLAAAPPPCASEADVSTAEAADLLGVTERQVCRMAEALGGRRSRARGRPWVLSRAAVLAELDARRAS